MHQEHKEIELTLELVSGQFEFLENSTTNLFVVKNSLFEDKIRCNRPINGCLAIDGYDGASFGDSMLLFDNRLIVDEGSRYDFIA